MAQKNDRYCRFRAFPSLTTKTQQFQAALSRWSNLFLRGSGNMNFGFLGAPQLHAASSIMRSFTHRRLNLNVVASK